MRLRLEQVLGHHAVLMIRLMRGPIDNEPTFVAAAQGALDRNTDELVDAVGQAYGDNAGTQFRSLWEEHIRLLRDYSEAVADHDQKGMDKAMSALHAYADRYGKLIATATDGELSADAVAAGVAEHIHHMIAATDAYEAGDFTRAFQFQREAYAAMFGTAKSLAGAAVTRANGELPVAFDSPGENLKSGLGQLLGEHVELAFDATRAIVAGQPAAEAAAQALNENTQDILTAMQGAVGDQASAAFGRVWAEHINALVAFSVGVADDNDKAQAAARAHLDDFPGKLSALWRRSRRATSPPRRSWLRCASTTSSCCNRSPPTQQRTTTRRTTLLTPATTTCPPSPRRWLTFSEARPAAPPHVAVPTPARAAQPAVTARRCLAALLGVVLSATSCAGPSGSSSQSPAGVQPHQVAVPDSLRAFPVTGAAGARCPSR